MVEAHNAERVTAARKVQERSAAGAARTDCR
jgi:hypothetical protein